MSLILAGRIGDSAAVAAEHCMHEPEARGQFFKTKLPAKEQLQAKDMSTVQ